MEIGRHILTSVGAAALLTNACGGECVETRILYEATLRVGSSDYNFSGFDKEREQREAWPYIEAVADDISNAPTGISPGR